jgi:uncharacterized membrane protein YphA (DoxX/SURF4 family)
MHDLRARSIVMATHAPDYSSAYLPRAGAAPTATDRFFFMLGRVVYALPFIAFGVVHLTNARQMAPLVPIPGGIFWVYFTGAAFILASLGIITGVLGRYAALGLAAMLFTFIALVHVPGLQDPTRREMSMVQLLKDLALAGGAIALSGAIHDAKLRRRAMRRGLGA